MKCAFAYLLVALVLFQTFSRELLVVDFALNRANITARFCVNKARPIMHCNGKCYFTKKLKQQQEQESKSAGLFKERLEMLPSAFGHLAPNTPAHCFNAEVKYPLHRLVGLQASSSRGVFHPPQG